MMAALSERVPDRFLSEAFAQTLRAETGSTTLVLHLDPESSRFNISDWHALQSRVNGEFVLSRFVETTEGGVALLRLNPPPPDEEDHVAALVAHCARSFQYVILRAGPTTPLSLLMKGFRLSDRIFLLLQGRSEDIYSRDLLRREVSAHPQGAQLQIRSIVCQEKGEEKETSDVLRAKQPEVHAVIHGCPSRSACEGLRRWPDRDFNADLRRLAREVGHRRVGLALSSGGARGLAHIGVIQVLEEHGIEVDMISGCSMGSYIGAVWAYGHDGVAMERLAREVEYRWGLFELIDPFILPRQGFLRGEKVKGRLKRSIGDIHFSELMRPLRIVATHLASLDRVVFSSGEVAQAVHASSAIPGACVPVNIDGELYIDGGIADPLPVDVLEEMGIERIIAINTIPTPAYLRARLEVEKEREARRGKKTNRLKSFVNRYLNYFAPGNVLDTILRSFNGAQMQVAEHSCQFADVVLRPLSFDGRWHDFRRPGKYIAIGRREAEQRLDEVKALVKRKDPTYEALPAQLSVAASV
jgi:NTE family protein